METTGQVTMEQLHQDITRVREDLAKMRETLAIQGQMFTQVLQRLDQTAQTSAQQGAQIIQLMNDVSVIKSDTSTWKSEMTALTARIADMPNQYVPRKEHEAQRYAERLLDLEKRIDEHQKTTFTNVVQWGISLIALASTVVFFILSYVHH